MLQNSPSNIAAKSDGNSFYEASESITFTWIELLPVKSPVRETTISGGNNFCTRFKVLRLEAISVIFGQTLICHKSLIDLFILVISIVLNVFLCNENIFGCFRKQVRPSFITIRNNDNSLHISTRHSPQFNNDLPQILYIKYVTDVLDECG